ncbi:MAG: FkbM family methyltransferase [Bacilli bacterium]|nr:FkbM family methyltransferase [Bacilli bacterium]
MKTYLSKILDDDMSITHGVYEPPNNVPIMRYKIHKQGYKTILLADSDMALSCEKWLHTEFIKPDYVFHSIEEIKGLNPEEKYLLILTNPNYKYPTYIEKLQKKLQTEPIDTYMCPYDYEKIPRHDLDYLAYFQKHKDKIIGMLDELHDEESKKAYVEYIRSKVFYDFYRETQLPTWDKYIDESVYHHKDDEVFVNCGSSNGDTIFYYLDKFDTFKKIYAVDGDQERCRQLKDNLGMLPEETRKKIQSVPITLDTNEHTLDNLFGHEDVSLINMDIEGMELDTLKRARRIITENKPVIAACAYHLPSDLLELPLTLKAMNPDYELLYRKYASTSRNRFCNAELVLYAVPQKRLVR